MSEKEIDYWLNVFKENNVGYHSHDGKKISLFKVFDILKEMKIENQKLRKQLEKTNKTEIYIDAENIEERYCNDLYQDYLEKENKKLKKQLENCYCNRTDCSSRIKNSKKYDSLAQKVESQQKEFIKLLEVMYHETEDIWYIKILNEYKKIIGDK